jgi:hypothetical protein
MVLKYQPSWTAGALEKFRRAVIAKNVGNDTIGPYYLSPLLGGHFLFWNSCPLHTQW